MRTLPIAYTSLIEQAQMANPPLLNQWLKECHMRGCDPDEMVEALVKSGRPLDIASVMVFMSRNGLFLSSGTDEKFATRSAMGTPDVPDAVEHVVDLGDRKAIKRMTLNSLRATLYDDFLSPEECDHIIAQAQPYMRRSAVVGKNFSNVETRIRSSAGTFFDRAQDEVVDRIEQRVARLTNIPVINGEGLQILHYAFAQEYQPHFDFFEPQNEEEAQMLMGPGNRVETLIFYLNDPEEGGATYFPQLKLSIHPKKGSVIRFSYLAEDGILDRRSEHAGLPLVKGEKWIMTKWLREREFHAPPVRTWADDVGRVVEVPKPAMAAPSAEIVPIGGRSSNDA